MKLKWVGIFTFALLGVFVSGCGRNEDPRATACKRLEIKCDRSIEATMLDYELNKKINTFISQRESRIEASVRSMNRSLSNFTSKSFPVDVLAYVEIHQARFGGSRLKEKLDGVKVYSSSATLFPSEIKVREGVGKASIYQAISEECAKIKMIKCKIAYLGKIDGVWTKSDESSSKLSGWIELESVVLLPINYEETKTSIRQAVDHDARELIWEAKGEISWSQIESFVEERVSQLKD